MRITHIELTNWGPHRHVAADTDAGILGIVGANGSGKSNLLQAIDYAFTGNLNGRPGVSYIRGFGTDDGAKKAVVRLSFKKDGISGEIVREIMPKSSKRMLTWDGGTYTKVEDVDRILGDILGVDKSALANAAFIKQGDIANLVQGTPAERNDIFRKLVRLGFVDKRSDDLLSRQTAIESGIKDYSETLAMLNARLEEEKKAVEGYTSDADAYEWSRDLLPNAEAYASAAQDVDRLSRLMGEAVAKKASAVEAMSAFDRRVKLELGAAPDKLQDMKRKCEDDASFIRDMITKTSKVAELGAVIDKAAKDIAEYKRDLAGIADWSDSDDRELAARVKDTAASADAYDRAVVAMKAYNKAKDDMIGSVDLMMTAKNILDGVTENEGRADRLRAEAADMLWQAKLYKAKLSVLCEGAPAKCPCCGRDIVLGSGDSMDALNDAISSLDNAMSDNETKASALLREAARAVTEYGKASSAVDVFSQQFASRKQELQTALEKGGIEAADIDGDGLLDRLEDKAESLRSDAEELEDMLTANRENAAEKVALHTKIAETEKAEAEAKVSLSALYNGMDEGTMDRDVWQAELKAATNKLDAVVARLVEYEGLTAALSSAEAAVDGMRAKLDEANTSMSDLWKLLESAASARGLDKDAVKLLESVKESYDTWTAARAGLSAASSAMDGTKAELNDVRDKVEKNKKRVVLVEDLKKIRAVIGKNGVPMAYMNTVFKSMSAMVQDLLPKMGANFAVEPNQYEPMSFTFYRTDDDSGHTMVQEQLSGGQAVRLALALLIACQQIVLPELGLLVLDEPSSHIDDEGIASMRDMFGELTTVMDSADMQLVIVDHNVNLMSAFGKTIRLGEVTQSV